jgi:ferrous iron transport protein B
MKKDTIHNLTIALAGNPNCGKTTLFNALTGAKQYVGNWPGVTVERMEGIFTHQNTNVQVIDLPGIYSFSAYSLDEKVSREFILLDKPDLVVNIIDATNLERNLYLTAQLLEMKIPLVVALNMMDAAKQKKIRIEVEHLATHLNCPVIPIVAAKKQGVGVLKDAIIDAALKHEISKTRIHYDDVVENAINLIQDNSIEFARENNVDNRWLAIKLLEKDELALKMTSGKLSDIVAPEQEKIEKHTNIDVELVVADGRYGFIHGLKHDVVHRDREVKKNISDVIDTFTLNRWLSIPIFFFVMYLVFMLTINVGAPFVNFFDQLMGTIFVDGLGNLLQSWHFPTWLITIVAGGIGGGIQAVSTFIPPIFFMFLSLSFLEDSGYMSRAAFVMDRFMRFIGLPGKAFIPMIVGFGCNVPAIMATRTLDNPKDRTLSILINPFMSCGARLPVYAFFATVFFPRNGGAVIFGIYMIGIILAILSGLLFRRTLFKGETSTFVMELPSYHIPTFNGIMMHAWQRLKGFILRAGKIIIFVVVLLTIINSVGIDGSFGNEDSSNSILSYLGRKVTPAFNPMGISNENWPATVGLITGIFAKETVVGTINALYEQIGDNTETEDKFEFKSGILAAMKAIPDGFKELKNSIFNPLGIGTDEETSLDFKNGDYAEMRTRFGNKKNAFAYLLFVLIYMPCVAVVAIIKKEAGTKWAIFSVAYLTILAWIISTLYYQISIFRLQPITSSVWIAVCLAASAIFYGILKYRTRKN